jgi:type 2 lantibiotic biosynthesis protein LanM
MTRRRVQPVDWLSLAAAASTLTERLDEAPWLHQAPPDPRRVADRLERWVQTVANGRAAGLTERLARAGVERTRAEAALGSIAFIDTCALPEWTSVLMETLECLPGDDASDGLIDARRPIPFEGVFLPYITVARRRLLARAAPWLDRVAAAVLTQLERRLLLDLSWVSSRTLELRFSLIRSRRTGPMAALGFNGGGSTVLYDEFVSELRGGGLADLWTQYPVLARLTGTLVEQHVNGAAEFFEHLADDRAEIARAFDRPSLGALVRILPSQSDRHNSGRTVLCLQFDDGFRLVYKPKDLGLDAAFFALVEWLNGQGLAHPLPVLRLLTRHARGWVQFVESCPCADEGGARRYYWRSGALLCLAYALQGVDLHQENLVAAGEYPYPIDLETILHPPRRDTYTETGSQAVSISSHQIEESVLRVGMLPSWDVGPGGRVFDSSGLGGVNQQQSLFQHAMWHDVNTDAMRVRYESIEAEMNANVPRLGDVPLDPQPYVADIVDGFESTYRLLQTHQAMLLGDESPLRQFDGQTLRFVFRATNLYAALREKLLHPRYLREGADRGIELEVLVRPFLAGQLHPAYYPMVAVEQRALERLDVPSFTTTVEGCDLVANDGTVIPHCFESSAIEQCRARIAAFGPDDLTQQVELIKASFGLRDAGHAVRTFSGGELTLDDRSSVLDAAELTRHALALAREIDAHAVRAADGSASWIGPVYVESAQRYQLHTLSLDLYDGLSGVGLFLAALTKVTRDAQARDLARAAFQSVCTAVYAAENGSALARLMGVGALTGVGAIVYGLLRAGDWLEDARLVDAAEMTARLITPEALDADAHHDFVAGSAGAILALRALNARRPSADLVGRMRACGDHLLERRTPTASGHRVWQHATIGRALTGFAHGTAGIAYALLRLAEATGDDAFRDAAIEAMDFEDSYFSPERGNWADTRGTAIYGNDDLHYVCTWCYGAAGIGLGRVASLAVLDTPALRTAVQTAIETTKSFGVRGEDHLCCGTLGRLELYLTASRVLGDESLRARAHEDAATVVRAAVQRQRFVMPQAAYSPSLFVGTAGIGYQLLRLAAPDTVPAISLLD